MHSKFEPICREYGREISDRPWLFSSTPGRGNTRCTKPSLKLLCNSGLVLRILCRTFNSKQLINCFAEVWRKRELGRGGCVHSAAWWLTGYHRSRISRCSNFNAKTNSVSLRILEVAAVSGQHLSSSWVIWPNAVEAHRGIFRLGDCATRGIVSWQFRNVIFR